MVSFCDLIGTSSTVIEALLAPGEGRRDRTAGRARRAASKGD